jgi:hypothetical protein
VNRVDEYVLRLNAAASASGAGWWTIWRHGGNANHRLRSVGGGAFREMCHQYAAMRKDLRQGLLILVGPDGTIASETSAPRVRRLRSRW